MIKELMVALVVGSSPPVHMDIEDCLAARDNIRAKGGTADCITSVDETKWIEAQIVENLKELKSIRRKVDTITRESRKIAWCRTIAKNGSFPGRVYPFSEKEEYWPEGIKLSLDECIRLIGGRRDPTSKQPPQVVIAHLKRGYR